MYLNLKKLIIIWHKGNNTREHLRELLISHVLLAKSDGVIVQKRHLWYTLFSITRKRESIERKSKSVIIIFIMRN